MASEEKRGGGGGRGAARCMVAGGVQSSELEPTLSGRHRSSESPACLPQGGDALDVG